MKVKNYMALGIAIGTGIGTLLGVAFENVSAGVALGAGVGLIMGRRLKSKAKNFTNKSDDSGVKNLE